MKRLEAPLTAFFLATLLAAPARAASADSWKRDFLDRVRFSTDVASADADMVRGLLSAALDTPTGAERGRRFVAGGGRITLAFDVFGATRTADGSFRGKGGQAGYDGDKLTATLDPLVVSTSCPFAVETLAHEVLGHGVSHLEARRAGVLKYWESAADDEPLAETVGLLVSLELGRPIPDEDPVSALFESTAAFSFYQWSGRTGTPASFSPEDVDQPSAALANRLESLEAAEVQLRIDEAGIRSWHRIARHFIQVHGRPLESFDAIFAQLDSNLDDIAARRAKLQSAYDSVHLEQDYLVSTDGPAFKRGLRSRRARRFFAAQRDELLRLQAELKATHRPAPAPAAAGKAGKKLTFDALQTLYTEDQNSHPEHWR